MPYPHPHPYPHPYPRLTWDQDGPRLGIFLRDCLADLEVTKQWMKARLLGEDPTASPRDDAPELLFVWLRKSYPESFGDIFEDCWTELFTEQLNLIPLQGANPGLLKALLMLADHWDGFKVAGHLRNLLDILPDQKVYEQVRGWVNLLLKK